MVYTYAIYRNTTTRANRSPGTVLFSCLASTALGPMNFLVISKDTHWFAKNERKNVYKTKTPHSTGCMDECFTTRLIKIKYEYHARAHTYAYTYAHTQYNTHT